LGRRKLEVQFPRGLRPKASQFGRFLLRWATSFLAFQVNTGEVSTTFGNNLQPNALWDKDLEPIVRMDSTFGTWVQWSRAPYNLYDRRTFYLCFRKGHGGSCFGICDLRAGAGIRQLPECVYLPLATWFVRSASWFGLLQLRTAHPFL
jgi:hypothetical protein